MKKHVVFYHVWTSREPLVARFLVDEQLKRLSKSGLRDIADIYCCVSGPDYSTISPILEHHRWVKVLATSCPQPEFEFGTLKYLWTIVRDNPQYEFVMYFHTKGLLYYDHLNMDPGAPSPSSVNSWRHFMEYFVIDKWREAVCCLSQYDAAGCCLVEGPFLHYAGNFWWAAASYIRTLEDPRTYLPESERVSGENRMKAEQWLGSNANSPDRFKILSGWVLPPMADRLNVSPYYADTEFSYLPIKAIAQP